MFRTSLYSVYFILTSSVLWCQHVVKASEGIHVIPSLVALFAVTHIIRLVQLSYELSEEGPTTYCLMASLVHEVAPRSTPSVNLHYVLASVVLLFFFDYTLSALVLAGSFLASHALYKHCLVTYYYPYNGDTPNA